VAARGTIGSDLTWYLTRAGSPSHPVSRDTSREVLRNHHKVPFTRFLRHPGGPGRPAPCVTGTPGWALDRAGRSR
jgi:hypothetical protein